MSVVISDGLNCDSIEHDLHKRRFLAAAGVNGHDTCELRCVQGCTFASSGQSRPSGSSSDCVFL